MEDLRIRSAKTEAVLHRKIDPMLYIPDEFESWLREKNHFLIAIMAGDKNFLIGDASDLERLGHSTQPDGREGFARGDRRTTPTGRSKT